jgi:hypothetical protein
MNAASRKAGYYLTRTSEGVIERDMKQAPTAVNHVGSPCWSESAPYESADLLFDNQLRERELMMPTGGRRVIAESQRSS